jgi:hypothetical protein
MASRNPRLHVYDPKTLAVMDQAFAAIWAITRGTVRDYANDSELRIAVGRKLLNLVADGVTDPIRLRQLTVESLSPRRLLTVSQRRSFAALIRP